MQVAPRRRVVDATYLSPTIPATSAPPFLTTEGAAVVAVNQLATLVEAPDRFVIVGAGKTATDAIVWLLTNGVPAERITWIRPREPWMLNRATVQPDPAVALRVAADTMTAAAEAAVARRHVPPTGARRRSCSASTATSAPTMARAPTLGLWELNLLRTIDHVVRLGHVKCVTEREIILDEGYLPLPANSLVVHCAASGCGTQRPVPLWQPDKIRLQTIRAGFPCFAAALAGFVEATRDDDRERNRLCPPNAFSNSPASWARMQLRGSRAARTYGAEPDIAAWANECALNPARVPSDLGSTPAVQEAASRLAAVADEGLTGLATLIEQPSATV